MINNPLVSVVVITYNSFKTVIDTLDSILSQTYKNIELVVSDDGSKDDTVNIVRTWLNLHSERFVRVEMVTVEKNSGTVSNINRGVKLSNGVWIKSIAGDDILKPNCIDSFIKFVLNTPDCKMCCCDLDLFTTDDIDLSNMKEQYSYYFNCVREPQFKQWRRIKYELTIPGPGYFYSRELYDEVGGFDSDYILLEETPFVFNVLKKGYRIYPVVDKLVLYRITSSSVCRGEFSNTFMILLNDKYSFFKKCQFPALIQSGMFFTAIMYLVNYNKVGKEVRFGINSLEAKFSKLFYFFSPLHYYHYFKNILRRFM